MPWTYLLSTSGNEDFWISRFPGTISHVTAFAKHTVTVRRYRRIQRLWKPGGKYFFRERLPAAFKVWFRRTGWVGFVAPDARTIQLHGNTERDRPWRDLL